MSSLSKKYALFFTLVNLYLANIHRSRIDSCLLLVILLFYPAIFSAIASSSPQKVDTAVDSNFEVKVHNGYTYCVAPYLGKDGIYYAYETARKDSADCIGYEWRYDVHGHISTIIASGGVQSDERYLCMTDVASDDTSTYSYIQLKPCSVNNTRQIWKYNKTNKQMINQHTGNRMQETGWYLATSANPNKLWDIQVTGRSVLFELVPAPFTTAYNFSFHYPVDKQSYSQILGKDGRMSQGSLRYNPETKQITTVLPDGKQYCLRSNMLGSSHDSEFVSFQRCPDKYGDGIVPNPLKWTISASVRGKQNTREFPLIISDFNKNLFGVERGGGINIGTGYTIKPQAAASIPDKFKPLYVFLDGGENFGRKTYMAGNYLGSLRTGICPAPGIYKNDDDNDRLLKLPPNFNLSLWLQRLYRISTHPGGGESLAAGICGACLLHAAEMLLEMQRHGNNPPGDNIDAQLFGFQEATSLGSFRQRFPLLTSQLDDDFELANLIPFHPNFPISAVLASEYLNGVFLSTLLGREGLVMTTSNFFNLNRVLEDADLLRMFNEMIVEPPGTMFVIANGNINHSGIPDGHATAFVINEQGQLHAIPTSEPDNLTTQQDFNDMVNLNITTPELLRFAIQIFRPGEFPIITEAVILTFRPDTPQTPAETFDEGMFSVGNCSEGGAIGGQGIDHGAGGGEFLAVPQNLYQCTEGRCDTSARQASINSNDDLVLNWPHQCELLEWIRGKWDWNGGSAAAKSLRNEQSCRAANRCRQGGACFRWAEFLDIGQCEHLGRDRRGHWKWMPYGYYSRAKACRDANRCRQGGACFRWNENRIGL